MARVDQVGGATDGGVFWRIRRIWPDLWLIGIKGGGLGRADCVCKADRSCTYRCTYFTGLTLRTVGWINAALVIGGTGGPRPDLGVGIGTVLNGEALKPSLT